MRGGSILGGANWQSAGEEEEENSRGRSSSLSLRYTEIGSTVFI